MDDITASPTIVTNFGGNVQFQPQHRYVPRDEAEVLAILNRHATGKIRVVGARHAWSDSIITDNALMDLFHFQEVKIERNAHGEIWAIFGGGCTIERALEQLDRQANATLPTLGLISEQTIAGAISTATHGSGRPSMSHYLAEIRVAAYDPDTGQARIYVWSDGPQLRAARCALGCMGIVLSVKLRCLPQYAITESVLQFASLDAALAQEAEHPLQQFYLVPYAWTLYAQQRRPLSADAPTRSWHAAIYRIYWYLFIDIALHATIRICAAWLRSRRLVHLLFGRLLPALFWKPRNRIDRSDRILVMEHELFRHLEIEIFVPARQVHRAADFVQQVLAVFDGAETLDPLVNDELDRLGLLARLVALRGTFTHHYPITFRRVLPDDTLISMTADAAEPYYAISFITYVEPREAFYKLASFLAESMVALHAARLHWGKYFPLEHAQIRDTYPGLAEFRAVCRQTDPHGVFCNDHVRRVLGF